MLHLLYSFPIFISNFFFCHCLFGIDSGLIFLGHVFFLSRLYEEFPVGQQNICALFFHLGNSVEPCGKVGAETSQATDKNCLARLSVSHYQKRRLFGCKNEDFLGTQNEMFSEKSRHICKTVPFRQIVEVPGCCEAKENYFFLLERYQPVSTTVAR